MERFEIIADDHQSCSRSSSKQPHEVFCKKGVLKNFAKFAEKHFCKSLFFNKDSGLS